jgi:hypothetical protein
MSKLQGLKGHENIAELQPGFIYFKRTALKGRQKSRNHQKGIALGAATINAAAQTLFIVGELSMVLPNNCSHIFQHP